MKVQLHFIIYSPKVVGISYGAQQLIASFVQNLLSVGIDSNQFELHIASTKADMLKELMSVGASPESLPEVLGGKFQVAGVAKWCKQLFGSEGAIGSISQFAKEETETVDDDKAQARQGVHDVRNTISIQKRLMHQHQFASTRS